MQAFDKFLSFTRLHFFPLNLKKYAEGKDLFPALQKKFLSHSSFQGLGIQNYLFIGTQIKIHTAI
jgi:hypothetical protein